MHIKKPHQKSHLPSALHRLLPSGEHMRLQELALPKTEAKPVLFFKKNRVYGIALLLHPIMF